LAAKSDGSGGYVCPAGRTLSVVAAQEAVALLDDAVDSLQQRAASSEGRLDMLQDRVDALQGQLETLTETTALSTRVTAVPFAVRQDGTVAPARFTVTCGDGRAVSGSAKTTDATVAQSFLSDDGHSWTFEIRALSSSGPSATAYVVCEGASSGGATAPAPGG
jgi:ABC-type transport system involved in cytochrome bd biosynthesis fused ATPase/permease subunit